MTDYFDLSSLLTGGRQASIRLLSDGYDLCVVLKVHSDLPDPSKNWKAYEQAIDEACRQDWLARAYRGEAENHRIKIDQTCGCAQHSR